MGELDFFLSEALWKYFIDRIPNEIIFSGGFVYEIFIYDDEEMDE